MNTHKIWWKVGGMSMEAFGKMADKTHKEGRSNKSTRIEKNVHYQNGKV
jgi:hypothetical protein